MSDLPPPPPPERPQGPPEYKVYRSRRRLRDRLGPLAANPLEAFRKRQQKRDGRPPQPGGPKPPKKITPLRVLKWVALAIAGWLLISLVVFFISAQTAPGVSQKTKDALQPEQEITQRSPLVQVHSSRCRGDEQPDRGFGVGYLRRPACSGSA